MPYFSFSWIFVSFFNEQSVFQKKIITNCLVDVYCAILSFLFVQLIRPFLFIHLTISYNPCSDVIVCRVVVFQIFALIFPFRGHSKNPIQDSECIDRRVSIKFSFRRWRDTTLPNSDRKPRVLLLIKLSLA